MLKMSSAKQAKIWYTSGSTHSTILDVASFFVGEETIAIIWAMDSPAGVDGVSVKYATKWCR